jgi:hypothetical protein
MQDKPEEVDRRSEAEIEHSLDYPTPQAPPSGTATAGWELLKALGSDLAAFASQLWRSLASERRRPARLAPFRRGEQIAGSYPLIALSSLPPRPSAAQTWLLLTYKLPPEPAARRVALWRQLKGMGGIYLQSSVCLLPKTDDHVRRLKLLENQIAAMGGDAVILETVALDRTQETKVVSRFRADRDESYREFVERCDAFEAKIVSATEAKQFGYAELEENDLDLNKLRDWLDKIHKLDFYGGGLAAQASDRLWRCESLLDTFARSVFEANDPLDPMPAA